MPKGSGHRRKARGARRIKDDEPEKCAACGKPATTEYPPDARGFGEAAPSCGSTACELRMQAAADYHADRGG